MALGGMGELYYAIRAWRTQAVLLCRDGRQEREAQVYKEPLDVGLGSVAASTAIRLWANRIMGQQNHGRGHVSQLLTLCLFFLSYSRMMSSDALDRELI